MPRAYKNQVRIIAGLWRGRKITFPEISDLRPTPDRIRETLFNWLAPVIHNAVCLDAFAGSGALGFEALSRGASHVTFIDQAADVINAIKTNASKLNATNIDIIQTNDVTTLSLKHRFDIVFLDPPFHQQLLPKICVWLEQQRLLNPDAYIYLESETSFIPEHLPTNWSLQKDKTAGLVSYRLFKKLQLD